MLIFLEFWGCVLNECLNNIYNTPESIRTQGTNKKESQQISEKFQRITNGTEEAIENYSVKEPEKGLRALEYFSEYFGRKGIEKCKKIK